MDVGAYAAKRAAALAKSKELKVAVELGQRKTGVRDGGRSAGRSNDSSEKALQAEQARAAWLAKKKQQDRQKRQAEAEKKHAKQRAEQEWQQQREERATAAGRRSGRPGSASAGRLTPPAKMLSASAEGGGITCTQSLPVLVPSSNASAVTGPREILRQRRQRRQSQSNLGSHCSDGGDSSNRGRGANGRGRGNATRSGKLHAGRRGSSRKPRPESAAARRKKTAASALEVEAATERIKAADAQEMALRELLDFAMSDVEGIAEFEKQAETRPQSAPEVGQTAVHDDAEDVVEKAA